MPTHPLKGLLDRDIAKVLAKPTRDIAIPLLRELVNDATNVFARCLDSSEGGKTADLVVLFSYYHIAQMTDGIESLLSEACGPPAVLLLRSSFEAVLSIKYILQTDSERRASAYVVANAHRKLRMHRMFDSDTAEGKDYLQALRDDESVGKLDVSELKQLAKRVIEELQRLVGNEKYEETRLEYQELMERRKRQVEWYQLFDGPANLRALAHKMKYGAVYDFLYRIWSDVTHAGDVLRPIMKTVGGETGIRPIRNVDGLASIAGFAVWMMLESKRLVLRAFRPGEDAAVRRWYAAEIRAKYLALYGG